jgi:hypothetical protein
MTEHSNAVTVEGAALQTLLRRPRVEGNYDHYFEGVTVAYNAGINLALTQAAATAWDKKSIKWPIAFIQQWVTRWPM